jgi:hypothetical protein
MPYTYPIDARALFEDRAHQFVGFGLPADDVARVRAATTDFWTNGPGGWVYQWSELAAEYTAKGAPLLQPCDSRRRPWRVRQPCVGASSPERGCVRRGRDRLLRFSRP